MAITTGRNRHHHDEEHTSNIYSKLILQGKIIAVVRWLTKIEGGGTL